MKLAFDWKKVMLANVNVRAEKHGDETEPASDLKFEADVSNDFLADISPSLKAAFYFYDDARGDLADQGKKEPGYLPHLKYPRLDVPLKWNDEMPSASVSIRQVGAEDASIELEPVKVNELKMTPKEGGTVAISFRVQCHPSQGQFGQLAGLVQREVEISLTEALAVATAAA